MGQAMREYETRQRQTGETPALDSSQCAEIMKGRPVVLGGSSPNGKAMALLSCRCGRSVSVELVRKWTNYDREDGDVVTLSFDVPEGWIVSIRDVDMRNDITVVRCPEHNFTPRGPHV